MDALKRENERIATAQKEKAQRDWKSAQEHKRRQDRCPVAPSLPKGATISTIDFKDPIQHANRKSSITKGIDKMSTSDYAAKFLKPENLVSKELPAYVLSDFRQLFIRDCANKYSDRFDVGDFIDYVKTHTYHGKDYSAYLQGFVNKKVAEEHFAHQAKKRQEADERARKIHEENEAIRAKAAAEAEAKMKERARRAYPFSDEAFEKDWDNHLRARYAARKMNTQPANPRDYQRGLPGYYTQSLRPMDVSEQPLD